MKIDREEARRIATLAQLEFNDESLDRMSLEMSAILTYVEQLHQLDLEELHGDEPSPGPLREDVPHAPLDPEAVARNAPSWRNGFFVVPKVIGSE